MPGHPLTRAVTIQTDVPTALDRLSRERQSAVSVGRHLPPATPNEATPTLLRHHHSVRQWTGRTGNKPSHQDSPRVPNPGSSVICNPALRVSRNRVTSATKILARKEVRGHPVAGTATQSVVPTVPARSQLANQSVVSVIQRSEKATPPKTIPNLPKRRTGTPLRRTSHQNKRRTGVRTVSVQSKRAMLSVGSVMNSFNEGFDGTLPSLGRRNRHSRG